MRTAISLLGIVALLLLSAGAAGAWGPCDFLTGGGYVIRDSGAKGTFAIGGGCKHESYWGHLEYHDHGTGLNVHWLTITAYMPFGEVSEDPKTHQPIGARFICGTARTNLPAPNDSVDFLAYANDKGEPGVDDEFWLRLSQSGVIIYSTQYDTDFTLGGPNDPGGGNIQLHKPNNSNSGDFGGPCPALSATLP